MSCLSTKNVVQSLYNEYFLAGLIDYFTTIFFEVSAACFEGEEASGIDSKVVLSMLQTLLETLHSLFK